MMTARPDQRDLKRLVVEQRDTQQRQREQDEVDGYSEHKDRFDHNVLEWPRRIRESQKSAAGTVRYFSAFSQPAISLAATLACCSSLPMVKKPWNWPGKCRYVTGTPASFNRAAYSAPSSRKGSAPAVST